MKNEIKVSNLKFNENTLKNLELRKLALQGSLTGYASVDKPWLKYYSDEHIKAEIPNMTAYQYLKEMNKDNLDLVAIDSQMGNYTYKELFASIDDCAKALYQMGVKKGDIVMEMLPILPHESFLLYGIDEVGAALAPLAPMTTPDKICDSINKFGAKVFVTMEYFLTPEIEKMLYENTCLENIINISFSYNSIDERTISWDKFIENGENTELPNINRNPEDLLFLASTGGSTGEPKSVMLNDNCFNIIVHQFINSDLDYKKGDKWIRLWPIFSASAAVSNHHLPLCTGACDLLRPFPQNISDFDKIIYEDKPNHSIMIPQLIDALEQSELLKDENMSYVKTAGCGGLAITPQFEKRVNKFYKEHNMNTFLGYGWGCTEASTSIAMRSNFATTKIGSAGAPKVHTVVAAFEPGTDIEKKYNEQGELCVKSHTLMMGYYNDEDLTKKVLKRHSDGDIWLHTGDLGFVSPDGLVTVNGRMSRMIFLYPTAKVYPQAMEADISKVLGVQEVVVCQVPDREHPGFYEPVCVIVPDINYEVCETIKRVKQLFNDKYKEYERPKQIIIKDILPLTKVGKPNVLELEKELENQEEKKIKKLTK